MFTFVTKEIIVYKSSLVHSSICLFNEKTNGPFSICFSENKVCVAQALSNCLFFFTVYSVEEFDIPCVSKFFF